MRLIGCDLHASQQSIAMLDRDTGVVVEKTLKHEGEAVREFYASIPPPVVVGIEATGSMGWFLRVMEDLAIECRVGHPVAIRKAESRRQKHDRRDGALLLQLLAEDRFPTIWMPSTELRDLRALLLHRHQWVRMRTRVQNALHAIAMAHGVRRGHTLWNRARARRYSRRCRWRRTRRIGAVSSRRCISTWMRRSIDSASGSSTSPMNAREPRCS
jgi:transposase